VLSHVVDKDHRMDKCCPLELCWVLKGVFAVAQDDTRSLGCGFCTTMKNPFAVLGCFMGCWPVANFHSFLPWSLLVLGPSMA
jgi:hypothetical protein